MIKSYNGLLLRTQRISAGKVKPSRDRIRLFPMKYSYETEKFSIDKKCFIASPCTCYMLLYRMKCYYIFHHCYLNLISQEASYTFENRLRPNKLLQADPRTRWFLLPIIDSAELPCCYGYVGPLIIDLVDFISWNSVISNCQSCRSM